METDHVEASKLNCAISSDDELNSPRLPPPVPKVQFIPRAPQPNPSEGRMEQRMREFEEQRQALQAQLQEQQDATKKALDENAKEIESMYTMMQTIQKDAAAARAEAAAANLATSNQITALTTSLNAFMAQQQAKSKRETKSPDRSASRDGDTNQRHRSPRRGEKKPD